VSPLQSICRDLQFSFGIHPVYEREEPDDWNRYARDWLRRHSMAGDLAVLVEGPSPKHPEANHRLELIELKP